MMATAAERAGGLPVAKTRPPASTPAVRIVTWPLAGAAAAACGCCRGAAGDEAAAGGDGAASTMLGLPGSASVTTGLVPGRTATATLCLDDTGGFPSGVMQTGKRWYT